MKKRKQIIQSQTEPNKNDIWLSPDGLKTYNKEGWEKVGTSTEEIESLVDDKINKLVDAAPEQLDTLKELSAALNDDANFANTVQRFIDITPYVDFDSQTAEGNGFVYNHTIPQDIQDKILNQMAPYDTGYAGIILNGMYMHGSNDRNGSLRGFYAVNTSKDFHGEYASMFVTINCSNTGLKETIRIYQYLKPVVAEQDGMFGIAVPFGNTIAFYTTGDGTKFLSDDGSYKEISSSGSGALVLDLTEEAQQTCTQEIYDSVATAVENGTPIYVRVTDTVTNTIINTYPVSVEYKYTPAHSVWVDTHTYTLTASSPHKISTHVDNDSYLEYKQYDNRVWKIESGGVEDTLTIYYSGDISLSKVHTLVLSNYESTYDFCGALSKFVDSLVYIEAGDGLEGFDSTDLKTTGPYYVRDAWAYTNNYGVPNFTCTLISPYDHTGVIYSIDAASGYLSCKRHGSMFIDSLDLPFEDWWLDGCNQTIENTYPSLASKIDTWINNNTPVWVNLSQHITPLSCGKEHLYAGTVDQGYNYTVDAIINNVHIHWSVDETGYVHVRTHKMDDIVDTDTLNSNITALQGSVADLLSRIEVLEGIITPTLLTVNVDGVTYDGLADSSIIISSYTSESTTTITSDTMLHVSKEGVKIDDPEPVDGQYIYTITGPQNIYISKTKNGEKYGNEICHIAFGGL